MNEQTTTIDEQPILLATDERGRTEFMQRIEKVRIALQAVGTKYAEYVFAEKQEAQMPVISNILIEQLLNAPDLKTMVFDFVAKDFSLPFNFDKQKAVDLFNAGNITPLQDAINEANRLQSVTYLHCVRVEFDRHVRLHMPAVEVELEKFKQYAVSREHRDLHSLVNDLCSAINAIQAYRSKYVQAPNLNRNNFKYNCCSIIHNEAGHPRVEPNADFILRFHTSQKSWSPLDFI